MYSAALTLRRTHGSREWTHRRHGVSRGVGTRGELQPFARARRGRSDWPRGPHQGDHGDAGTGVEPPSRTSRRPRFRNLRRRSLPRERARRGRRARHPVDRCHGRSEALRRVHPRDGPSSSEPGRLGPDTRRNLRRAVPCGRAAGTRGGHHVRLREAQRRRHVREPVHLFDVALVALRRICPVGSARGAQHRRRLSSRDLTGEAGVVASTSTKRDFATVVHQ